MVSLPRYSRVALSAIIASLVAPVCGILAEDVFHIHSVVLGSVFVVLFPTVPLFLGPDGGYDDPELANRALGFAIAANMLLYTIVFSVLWGVVWVIRRATSRPR